MGRDSNDSPETAVRRGRGAIGKGIKRNDSPEIADRKKGKGDSNDSPGIADRTERERSHRKGDQMTALRFQTGQRGRGATGKGIK